MASLRHFFDHHRHTPSADHWAALEDVVSTMAAMAEGHCPPKVFVSAVDPGIGKTQAMIHFARALVSSADHRQVGMMIGVARLNETASIAKTLGIPADRLAVLTSDEELNAITSTAPSGAQVLVTTQQRIERATAGRGFEGTAGFHYGGLPRRVRVWDESWLPGHAVTLSKDDLLVLPKLIRPYSPELADALPLFALSLTDLEDGAAVEVPNFAVRCGVSLEDIAARSTSRRSGLRGDQEATFEALAAMNGRTVRARQDGWAGNTLLTYRDTLPSDLAPLLVLDASGRVRTTYVWMEQHRGNLVRLRPAVKDYSPLTVHFWKTSGSKTGFERDCDALVKGIADTVLRKPSEDWLVVVHKPSAKVKDVAAALRRYLRGQIGQNLKVITWGNHMASNEFADVPNVILAGTLFMRESFYTALTHLAQDRERRTRTRIRRGCH